LPKKETSSLLIIQYCLCFCVISSFSALEPFGRFSHTFANICHRRPAHSLKFQFATISHNNIADEPTFRLSQGVGKYMVSRCARFRLLLWLFFPVLLPLHFLPGWTLVIGSQVGELRWGLGLQNLPSCVF